MNNKAFQAFLDKYGDQLCVITLDNNAKIYVEYQNQQSSVRLNEIKLETIGGVDMFAVPSWPMTPTEANKGITHEVWHPTEVIQALVLIDEAHKHLRVDPWQY